MEKILADAAQDAAHELTPAPFLYDPGTKGTKSKRSVAFRLRVRAVVYRLYFKTAFFLFMV